MAHTVGPPAQLTVDRRRFDAGQGHVLLVVTVAADAETARRQLAARVEAHGSGLIRVSATPVVPVFPQDAPGG
jgi:hypothetical protein